MRRHLDFTSIQQVLRVVAAGEQHSPRSPGELVPERIIVRVGSRKSAAVGLERDDPSAAIPHAVDYPHGRHVVDSGIHSDFIQDGDIGSAGGSVKLLHGRRNIGGRHHVLFVRYAVFRHHGMEGERHKTDREIAVLDQLRQYRFVLHIECESLAIRMAGDHGLRFAGRPARHNNLISLFEQITH